MLKSHDFKCSNGHDFDDLVHDSDPNPACGVCGAPSEKCISPGHSFGTIIPTYPGAKKRKAGYQHTHSDRPATKIQVSVPRK